MSDVVNERAGVLTESETAELVRMLAELHTHGYVDIEQHGKLRVGTRVRHSGQQWTDALFNGTGVVVALTEKPDSPWSRSWHMPDIELVVLFDKAEFGTRLSQLAQYHVAVIEEAS